MDDTSFIDSLDPLIAPVVMILRENGFDTFESCQGGDGHCCPEPMVRFEGNETDLLRAYEVCKLYNLPILQANRVFRKSSVYKDKNTPNPIEIGEAWDSPFNELRFLPFISFQTEYLNHDPTSQIHSHLT